MPADNAPIYCRAFDGFERLSAEQAWDAHGWGLDTVAGSTVYRSEFSVDGVQCEVFVGNEGGTVLPDSPWCCEFYIAGGLAENTWGSSPEVAFYNLLASGTFEREHVRSAAYISKSGLASFKESGNLGEAERFLLFSSDPKLREVAASSGIGLDILLHDPDQLVRERVARTGYGFRELAYDKSVQVRGELALGGYALDKLIDDPDEVVRKCVRSYLRNHGVSLDTWIYENSEFCARLPGWDRTVKACAESAMDADADSTYVRFEITDLGAASASVGEKRFSVQPLTKASPDGPWLYGKASESDQLDAAFEQIGAFIEANPTAIPIEPYTIKTPDGKTRYATTGFVQEKLCRGAKRISTASPFDLTGYGSHRRSERGNFMANVCEYDMYIVGNRAALAEIAKAAAGYGIYEMYVFEQEHKGDDAVLELYGGCRWSVDSAFLFTEHDGFADVISAFGATAEVWSTEPGCMFREHYLVTPEGIAVNETFKYREALYYEADMPFDQWRAENGIPEGVIRDDLEDGELYVECEAEIDWSPIVTPYGGGWIPSGTDIAYFGGARSFESQLQAIDAWAGTAEATKLDQPFDIDAAKRARTSSPMAQDSERGIHR